MSTFRSAYRSLTPAEAGAVEDLKASAEILERHIKNAPSGRHQSLAMTKLEEAVMWAVKGITG